MNAIKASRRFREFHTWWQKRCEHVRNAYYRRLFGAFGEGSRVLGPITVYCPERVYVGAGCTINTGVVLVGRDQIRIGDHVRISPGVMIQTGGLDFEYPSLPVPHNQGPVTIGRGAWLASGAIVTCGTTIGERAVVAAGAVVTKDVPAFTIVGGGPARMIGEVTVRGLAEVADSSKPDAKSIQKNIPTSL